jgi:hypothetical protein
VSNKAILKDGQVVPVDDLMEWGRWMQQPEARRIDRTQVADSKVSTVFLGLNHQFGDGPGLWFETMVFGAPEDQFCCRYSTLDEAKAGHATVVARLMNGETLEDL